MSSSNNTVHICTQSLFASGLFEHTFGAFQMCKAWITLWSKFLQEISRHRCSKSESTSQLVIGPVWYSKKWFLDPQRLLRKRTSTCVFHRFFQSSFSNSKKNSSGVRLSFKAPPAHMDIHWGWAVRQDLPIYLLFFTSKMWCRSKSSVSANFCHCTAFLPHSNTQIHSAATRACASARQQISILAKHACATVVRANDITPPTPTPARTTPPRPTQQQKCAKSVNV